MQYTYRTHWHHQPQYQILPLIAGDDFLPCFAWLLTCEIHWLSVPVCFLSPWHPCISSDGSDCEGLSTQSYAYIWLWMTVEVTCLSLFLAVAVALSAYIIKVGFTVQSMSTIHLTHSYCYCIPENLNGKSNLSLPFSLSLSLCCTLSHPLYSNAFTLSFSSRLLFLSFSLCVPISLCVDVKFLVCSVLSLYSVLSLCSVLMWSS